MARYIARILPAEARRIDYALLSHFHGDHMGTVVKDSPVSRAGGYQLSGITEIAEHLPIGRVIDRAWPDYAWPEPLASRNMLNYRRFLEWQVANRGMKVERFEPGRNDQLRLLRTPDAYPQFEIRNIAANASVWTGKGTAARSVLASPATTNPGENKLSIAFRVSYGKFDYFTGGDLSVIGEDTTPPGEDLMNVEGPIGRATGPVDAMKANHHGSWDANSGPFLRALQPRVIVVGTRAEGHPAVNTHKRMTSKAAWPGPRDIFVTNVSPATFKTTYGIEEAAGTQGHVVIRVAPGGASYRVVVLDDSNESMRVKAVFGPYQSR
ncbi:MAG: hypothetical protein EOP62_21280 [Sphingomonadales bacterium]|nr:MAG: hypothetical protein EOP62_21280 [Sphingomonadales bacterium]